MRRLYHKVIDMLLKIDGTAERTSLAFAIGVFLAFSPFFGLHTVLGLLIGFLFGFNRVAIMIGVYTNTPWTIVPFYAFATYFGSLFYEVPGDLPFHIKDLGSMAFWKSLVSDWPVLWPLLMPTFVGSMILSIVLGAISYPLALRILRTYHAKKNRGLTPIANEAGQ
ncbi:MAG: DUF2062 domain-containing protein [Acidobacteria bacterium]|nr:DUF2062 domain-containing protein [Acidobacteriota bacterium]MBI3655237.1 DUF2062 domain-containing protein [Acidobacteriota bacterium]